jgi:hypothetical protein
MDTASDPRLFTSVFRDRVERMRRVLPEETWSEFDEAATRIENYLWEDIRPSTRGVAAFCRAGDTPFFEALQFEVPFPESLVEVDFLPVIYHLIELKDIYEGYVVVVCDEASARILEVNLGAVTEELWRKRAELRKRVGREWTRRHYQNHQRSRFNQFVKEVLGVVEERVAAGGYKHIVLAGSTRAVARLRDALPRHLREKVIETITGASPRSDDVVAQTIAAFIEEERRESLSAVELLVQELRRDGLAAAGIEASRRALTNGQVDVLIIDRNLDETSREELVRLAGATSSHVETVADSPELARIGGVGCLLRYRIETADLQPAL